MKNRKHLSLAGIGPCYVIIISVVTVLFLFSGGKINGILIYPCKFIGLFFIIEGVYMWLQVVLKSRLHENIKENKLITGGIYAYVRNPIYSAFMFMEWGILLVDLNFLIVVAIPLYWIVMTVMLKRTEEKWLIDLYGDEYIQYCKYVNRCIPWKKRY